MHKPPASTPDDLRSLAACSWPLWAFPWSPRCKLHKQDFQDRLALQDLDRSLRISPPIDHLHVFSPPNPGPTAPHICSPSARPPLAHLPSCIADAPADSQD